jgi:hypothetical protein
MYGTIGSAVFVGMISILLIKKFNVKTIYGEPVVFSQKKFNKGQVYGGLIFGLGWAITGACPGPDICVNRVWRNSIYHYIIKRHRRHLVLWKIQKLFTSLSFLCVTLCELCETLCN